MRAGRSTAALLAVGAYIGGAYLFVVDELRQSGGHLGPHLSDSFTGIAPSSVAAFVVAQIFGLVAVVAVGILYPSPVEPDSDVDPSLPVLALRPTRPAARVGRGRLTRS